MPVNSRRLEASYMTTWREQALVSLGAIGE